MLVSAAHAKVCLWFAGRNIYQVIVLSLESPFYDVTISEKVICETCILIMIRSTSFIEMTRVISIHSLTLRGKVLLAPIEA